MVKERRGESWTSIIIMVIILVCFILLLNKKCPDTQESVAASDTQESVAASYQAKPQIFVLVNYTYRAEHEFRCESKDGELELNRTRLSAVLYEYREREVHYFETAKAIYRASMPYISIWHDGLEEDSELLYFMWNAEEQKADNIICWSYLLPYELGITVTYYDEGYAEGPFSVIDYERIVYDCQKEYGKHGWDCVWRDNNFDKIDTINFPSKIFDAIKEEIISEEE